MKNKLILAGMFTLLFGSCSLLEKKHTTQHNPVELNGKWHILELDKKRIPTSVNGKEPLLVVNHSENTYTVFTGCNNLGGELIFGKGNSIQFERGISTMMACDNMEVEHTFASLIPSINKYALVKDTLVLLSAKNQVLGKFLAKKEDINAAKQLSGKWQLNKVFGPDSPAKEIFANDIPTIEFNTEEETVSGKGTCNHYSGTYSTEGQKIKFGALASTKMGCAKLKEEALYFQKLEKTNSFIVDANKLTFYSEGQKQLQFTKIK